MLKCYEAMELSIHGARVKVWSSIDAGMTWYEDDHKAYEVIHKLTPSNQARSLLFARFEHNGLYVMRRALGDIMAWDRRVDEWVRLGFDSIQHDVVKSVFAIYHTARGYGNV